MKLFRTISVAVTLLLSGIVVNSTVQAQSSGTVFLKTTKVTFSGPVEIPGHTLPAGEYTIKLAPGIQTDVVQFRNKNDTKTIAMMLTIPDYRLTPTSKTVIFFRERAANAPEALRAWFYPGDNYGYRFIYPKKRATELAAANNVNVPSYADNTNENNLSGTHVTEVTPNGAEQEEQSAAANSTADQNNSATTNNTGNTTATNNTGNTTATNDTTTNSNANNNLVASNQPLPKTASDTFAIAFSGVVFVMSGLLVGFVGRRRSQES